MNQYLFPSVLKCLSVMLFGLAPFTLVLADETMANHPASMPQSDSIRSPWDHPVFREVPSVFPAEGFHESDVRAFFYEGASYRGKPTRVFAWYGVPQHGGPKFPAMVLVHGGGGTAFARWVRMWNERGYAAIALDTSGNVPVANGNQRHSWSGPAGMEEAFKQVDEPLEDQWPYHSVAAVMRAHSLIRTFPEIDSQRIGVTGISWGGYLTCMVAGIDDRFACAAPVYGCGYFDYNSGGFYDELKRRGERGRKWASLWDASTVLANARIPILWLNGTNDHWFPLPSFVKSMRLAPGTRGLVLRPHWAHGQTPGDSAPEIERFVDSVLKSKPPMPRIISQNADQNQLVVHWESPLPIVEAEFNYSSDSGVYEKRKWNTRYVPFDSQGEKVTIPIPAEATVLYCNIVDQNGIICSSQLIERQPTSPSPSAPKERMILQEDYEGRGVGISPKEVKGTDNAKGAGIKITDEMAASGTRALRFSDAAGLEQGYYPAREFYLRGNEQITSGLVTLSFQFRSHKTKPGYFVVEMRDMRKTPHQRGPRLEFMPNGKLLASGKEVAMLSFDSWTKVELQMTLDGQDGKTYKLTVSGPNAEGKTIDIPCSPGFGAVSWMAFMMPAQSDGVVYMDDVLFSCQ